MNKIIEPLNWRYATKKFDSTKKISNEDLETIKESLRLVPSSYGLQPLKFLIIEDTSLRLRLKERSFNQAQITDASHLLVICSLTRTAISGVMKLPSNNASITLLRARDFSE
jgi:nitroreductase